MVEIMCGGFTGEHEEMKVHKKAEIVDDNGYVVYLWKNYEQFGTIDVRDKSIHYANDVCENWVQGILTEDNEYITKS
tara:strand:+ start:902 stop:1132 length:231 start_codon:yes stop_codon:yes gene_type:complete